MRRFVIEFLLLHILFSKIFCQIVRPAPITGGRPFSYTLHEPEEQQVTRVKRIVEETSKSDVTTSVNEAVRAVIVPHGSMKATGRLIWKSLERIAWHNIRRVFLIGPLHEAANLNEDKYLLSPYFSYETPYGPLIIDRLIYSALLDTENFAYIDERQDRIEHSLENILPWLGKNVVDNISTLTIIPILIDQPTNRRAVEVGRLLSRYLIDAENLFIISTDLSHRGNLYGHTWTDNTAEIVRKEDHLIIKAISSMNSTHFHQVIDQTKHNMCGREAVQLLLDAINELDEEKRSKWFLDVIEYEIFKTLETSVVGCLGANLLFHNLTTSTKRNY